MKKGGHFFVCGDVGMASDVTTTLSKIIQEHGKMTSEQAQSYLLKLRVKSSTEFKIKTLNLLIFFYFAHFTLRFSWKHDSRNQNFFDLYCLCSLFHRNPIVSMKISLV